MSFWFIADPFEGCDFYKASLATLNRKRHAANCAQLQGSRFFDVLFILPAAIGTVFHLIPNFFPLFSPIKGPATANTVLAGQIALLTHAHDLCPIGVCHASIP
jgi:hypothetical protein